MSLVLFLLACLAVGMTIGLGLGLIQNSRRGIFSALVLIALVVGSIVCRAPTLVTIFWSSGFAGWVLGTLLAMVIKSLRREAEKRKNEDLIEGQVVPRLQRLSSEDGRESSNGKYHTDNDRWKRLRRR